MTDPVEQGIVVSVAEVVMGDELAADAAAGAVQLVLVDAVDFDEDGGQAVIGGETVTYLSADLDTDTLALAAALVGSYVAGEPVTVYPEARERVATVQLDVDGEAIAARVPHALYDRIPEGTRDVPDRVTLTNDGGEWVIADVLGQEPVVDGSFIDPATIPAPAASDGLVPPQVTGVTTQGGIGTVFVKWAAVANPDPVVYRLYAAAAGPVAPIPGNFLGEVSGTLATIRKMPNGDPLPTDTDTHFTVVAHDDDGDSPASDDVVGRALLVTGPDIQANTITGDKLVANTITAGEIAAGAITADELAAGAVTATKLTADAIDGKTITGATIRTAASGRRLQVGPDPQVTIYSGSPEEMFPAYFSADVLSTFARLIISAPDPVDAGEVGSSYRQMILMSEDVDDPTPGRPTRAMTLRSAHVYIQQVGHTVHMDDAEWWMDGVGLADVGFITADSFAYPGGKPVGPPTGAMFMFGGAAAAIPGGWLLCDGAAIPRPVFAGGPDDEFLDLYNVIGTTYGAGNGSSTFNLPDLRGRFPIGAGTFKALAGNDGLAEAARTPVHTHSTPNHTHTHNLATGTVDHSGGTVQPGTGAAVNRVGLLNGSNNGSHNHTVTGGVTSSGASTTGASAASAIPHLGINFIIKV